jgi:hypothetical protein
LRFFFFPSFRHQGSQTKTSFSCAKNYQTFGLKDKQEDKKRKKTNKSAALFFWIYAKNEMNEQSHIRLIYYTV